MTNRSEDEWSLVSDDEEVLSDMSFDEVEHEPDAQVESNPEVAVSKIEPPPDCGDEVETTSAIQDNADVVSLLADVSASERSTAGYTREIRVSLLSPAHQDWLVGAPPINSSPPSTVTPCNRSIKLAFIERGVRPKSRPFPEEVMPPAFTKVMPFMQDQSTQIDLDTASAEPRETCATLLGSALDRTMTLTNQLHNKSKDNERLSFRLAELESVAVQTEQKAQRSAMKVMMSERSLALTRQQAKLTTEYQHNLKTIAENLRQENADLAAQNAVLRGENEALAVRSVDELEALETILTCGMDSIRAALRAKYRAAMEKRREKELCIVCFSRPVSVVLLPCRHQVLCVSCAVRVTSCPIDRKDIQDKVLTHGLNAYTDSEN